MLAHLFTLVIYQPFFNVLVFLYWVLDVLTGGGADMGVAVILLTVVIRVLLLPISMMQDRSELERRQMAQQLHDLQVELEHDPIRLRAETKKLFRDKPQVVAGELFSLAVQVMISLMLWRMFSTGLEGKDIHLLYPFMPQITLPFNLVFAGQFDLAHPNIILNLIQSLMIFLLETLSIYTSPYPPSKGEVVRLQLILPVTAFFIFMFLPAGKKLFIITTLIFSSVITLIKYIRRRFEWYKARAEAAEQAAAKSAEEQPIVVQTK